MSIRRGRISKVERCAPKVRIDQDLGDVALLPGLVNAHTHLELSHLRGQVEPASRLTEWLTALIDRRAATTFEPNLVVEAIAELRNTGTVVVADVSNSLRSYGPLKESTLTAVAFYELIGFNVANPGAIAKAARATVDTLPTSDRVRAALAPHALYSVSSPLLRAISSVRDPSWPCSIHVAESADEIEFLQAATGSFVELLKRLGAWSADWSPPRCRPTEYLERHQLLNEHLLAVHGVHLDGEDLSALSRSGATVVTCPRSNQRVGAGKPPLEEFYRAGVRVAVGTDSLASVPDLNLFAELAEMRRLAPSVPPGPILQSATKSGADALGFGYRHGTIESGKSAELIFVDVPAGERDIEEYLLSGITAERIHRLDNVGSTDNDK